MCLFNFGWRNVCNIFGYFAILITILAEIVIEESFMHM